MSWCLDIRHVTGYRYERDVLASYNEVRLTPLSTDRQTTRDNRLDVEPAARLSHYWDYWGTMVHSFDIHVPHRELVVTATSTVDTPDTHDPHDGAVIGWADLDDERVGDHFYEYLAPTQASPADPELADLASRLRVEAAGPRDGVERATAWVRTQLAYERGTTSVSSSALHAWRHGRGVCQDFVHLSLALLRAMGIPARYVSGYFHPGSEAAIGETVVGESHAWAEVWLGDWWPVDPTNPVRVGSSHVLVARGREYRDVTPLRGIYSGSPSSTPTVLVEITRRA